MRVLIVMQEWSSPMNDDDDDRREAIAKLILGEALCLADTLDAPDFSTRVRQLSEAIREIGGDVVERALTRLRIAVQQSKLDKPTGKRSNTH